jgi:hypothetical protein
LVRRHRWSSALPAELERTIRAVVPALDGWCTARKGCYMAEFILGTEATTLVELGAYGGRGTVAMALACRHRKKGVVYGVDTWDVKSSLDGDVDPEDAAFWQKVDLERVYQRFLTALLDLNLTHYAVPLRMSSAQAARMFDGAAVDVLHQDSNHSEKVTCAEVEIWWPLVRSRGYWFVDDIHLPTTGKAYAMLLERGCTVEFNDGHWAALRKP